MDILFKTKIGFTVFLIGILILFCGTINAKIELPITRLNMPVNMVSLNNNLMQSNYVTLDNNSSIIKRKSTTKAVFLSLLMPGAGQLYLGEKGRGEVFIGAEVVIWGAFAVFQTLGKWKKDDYISYAQRHARIDASGKGDAFYDDLKFYDSRDQYNESTWLNDYSNPIYPQTQEYYWQWDSSESRELYKDIVKKSKENYRTAGFMIFGAIINRVIAGIDTFRIGKKLNKRMASNQLTNVDPKKIELDIDANPFGSNPNMSITLSHRF